MNMTWRRLPAKAILIDATIPWNRGVPLDATVMTSLNFTLRSRLCTLDQCVTLPFNSWSWYSHAEPSICRAVRIFIFALALGFHLISLELDLVVLVESLLLAAFEACILALLLLAVQLLWTHFIIVIDLVDAVVLQQGLVVVVFLIVVNSMAIAVAVAVALCIISSLLMATIPELVTVCLSKNQMVAELITRRLSISPCRVIMILGHGTCVTLGVDARARAIVVV